MLFLRLAIVTVLLWVPIRAADGQPTNMQVVERLVTECIAELPLPSMLSIAPDVRYESVSNAVVEHLREREIRVFASDTLGRQSLGYQIEDVSVAYQRLGRDYERNVRAVVLPRVLSESGEILHAGRCERSLDDIINRGDIVRIERGAPSEARAELPPASFRRRVAEPLLLAGATAVSVVLFFTLRSKRSTSE
jgi:hypothetical protein